ncbi:MAG TPA: PilZ domain-containing protein [Bryobacteraceae bacterium]|nr:PilZ domain-containing protein [Bryobacteraceae bacterium]
MERRREARLIANTPVMVTLQGMLGDPQMAANVLDMAGSGLRLRTAMPVPSGARVKVETAETLMLGEVLRCEPLDEGFALGLALSEVRARS